MGPQRLLKDLRLEAGLSLRNLAKSAGVATSTVLRIEKGELHPTVQMLERLASAAGFRLFLRAQVDSAASVSGLGFSVRDAVKRGNVGEVVRRAAELASRFGNANLETKHRMLASEPLATGDAKWDAFLGALAEWLSVKARLPPPGWALGEKRYLREGWFVAAGPSMRAWEYAGSPASFKTRGVYLHQESLTNV